jgi:iron complex transport system ATP-binding protein
MISISDVAYRVRGTKILDDVSVTIPKGKLTALIGPNGAGKSTLLKLAGRLEHMQNGCIEVDGNDVSSTPTEVLALKLAILGQQNNIASRLRLAELVSFGRWPHHLGRPGERDRVAVAEALAVFGLENLAGRFLDEVSGGQAQRAFLAMTFAQDTDWLLLDEPLNNLDMGHSRTLMENLSKLVREHGKSIVVVVHDVNFAAAWSDHIVAMKDGRVVACGAPHEVLVPFLLDELFDIRVSVMEAQGRPLVLHHR